MQGLADLSRRYPQKRAIVTGAASGLGFAFAKHLANEGWKLGLIDLDKKNLDNASRNLSIQPVAIRTEAVDITNYDATEKIVANWIEEWGGIDLLVNNAGVAAAGYTLDVPLADWEWIFRINLFGAVNLTKTVLPAMKKADAGCIINVSSAASFVSSPAMSPYNASKSALVSFSETLAGELIKSKVTVHAALPAFFRTNLLSSMRAPVAEKEAADLLMSASPMTAEKVAQRIFEGVAAGKFFILVPKKLSTLWRFKRFFPEKYLKSFGNMRNKKMEELRSKKK